MRSPVRTALLAATSVLAAAALVAPASASAQATVCPATFSVLHDDQIGRMSLPAGAYTVTLLDPTGLSCAEAYDLFRQFLEDWDGRLLDASHASLRDDYAASVPAVERTVERLRAAGAAGARMVGGGFGGAVLALLPPGVAIPEGARTVAPGPPARLL